MVGNRSSHKRRAWSVWRFCHYLARNRPKTGLIVKNFIPFCHYLSRKGIDKLCAIVYNVDRIENRKRNPNNRITTQESQGKKYHPGVDTQTRDKGEGRPNRGRGTGRAEGRKGLRLQPVRASALMSAGGLADTEVRLLRGGHESRN